MITRVQFLKLVEGADADASYSSKEIAGLISVPLGTLNGWLSDKRAFPPAEVGARKRRVYDNLTIRRLAIYAGCLENGYGLDASDARVIIASVDTKEIWASYLEDLGSFASYMISKKQSLIGDNNG